MEMSNPISQLFRPFQIGHVLLRNRLAVAPMSRVSARHDGVPTREMAEYYSSFASGQFGLIITEGIFPEEAHGKAYQRQPGLETAAQVEGWARVVEAVHQAGGVLFAQIMHAGALAQCHNNTIAPSAVQPLGAKMPEYGGAGPYPLPQAMGNDTIRAVIKAFAVAARNALQAGFDGIEIHGANGYLLDQFLTTYTNQRADAYGGQVENRIRFAAEVVDAARSAVENRIPVGIRLSETKVNDLTYCWPARAQEAPIIFKALQNAGAAFIHLAGEGRPFPQSSSHEQSLPQIARAVTGLPILANGGLGDPEKAARATSSDQADLVALGRSALVDPDWPRRVRTGEPLRRFEHAVLEPCATLDNAKAWLPELAALAEPVEA